PPHPTRFAGHLLPRGEKGLTADSLLSACALERAPNGRPPMLTLYGSGPMFGLPDPCPFVLGAMTQLRMAGVPFRLETTPDAEGVSAGGHRRRGGGGRRGPGTGRARPPPRRRGPRPCAAPTASPPPPPSPPPSAGSAGRGRGCGKTAATGRSTAPWTTAATRR